MRHPRGIHWGKGMTIQIWPLLQTLDAPLEAGSEETVETVLVETAPAETVPVETVPDSEPDLRQLLLILRPSLEQSHDLLSALNLPLAELAALKQPFVKLAIGILQQQRPSQQTPQQASKQVPKQVLSLSESIGLVAQAAYLDTFCETLVLPKIQEWLQQVGRVPGSATVQQQIDLLDWQLGEQDRRQVLVAFSRSRLAQAFNRILEARLEQLGIQPDAAAQIAAQIARQAEPQILPALTAVGDRVGESMPSWVAWYHEQDLSQLERHLRIDAYLEDQVASRPNELVFNESFSLKEIYVPLKAQHLTAIGEPDFDQPPIDLADWVLAQLTIGPPDQVLLVQAGFGRGKTSFCRIFADWVRQQEYPRWTPILISLPDLSVMPKDFQTLLQQAVPAMLTADPNWLTHSDTRFLFLLDGFSELHLGDSSNLEQFFQQVGRFQESCANHPAMGHRILLTGRSLMIKTLERLLPPNLLQVEILPLDAELQDRWVAQWGQLTGDDAAGLNALLESVDLPEHSLSLTSEPLMLYFLAAMHRDGELQLDSIVGASPDRAKFLLYQQIFYWALAKQRPGLLNRDLSLHETESLRRLLAEAGLWTVQMDTEAVPIASLSARLQHDDGVQTLIQEIQTKLQAHALTNALVTLYSRADQSYLRFNHNSFGKLFCSRRLHEALEDWATLMTRRRQSEPLVPVETLHWQIFDLLGYGGLTPEMTEYLMVLLNANPEVDTGYLFQRLEDFYQRWCLGQFIDAPPATLAQRARRLLEQQTERALGQRQVDVYTGLNVMIVLLQLYGYARSHEALQDRIAFYPCGRQGMPDFEPERLLRIIGYSHCISPSAFRAIVGPYLSSANLSGVSLTGANLSGVDLSSADLRSADLSGVNLRGANLSRANLIGASLDGADLSNSDLRGTNLIGANLRGADISHADLSGADLSSANLIGASLSRADLRDADLSGAYLRGASLQSATLSRAYLIGASLSGASLSNADMGQVDLSDANLHGADLSDVNLRHADLSGADLIGAYLNGATLCGAKLCNASLNSADLIGADLCGADLNSANLVGADLSDRTLSHNSVDDDEIVEVKWSEYTKWQNVRGLEAAINVPEALKQQLGLSEVPDSGN
jgi:uncharacterized protein YjbI with pentapeptide repeats